MAIGRLCGNGHRATVCVRVCVRVHVAIERLCVCVLCQYGWHVRGKDNVAYTKALGVLQIKLIRCMVCKSNRLACSMPQEAGSEGTHRLIPRRASRLVVNLCSEDMANPSSDCVGWGVDGCMGCVLCVC